MNNYNSAWSVVSYDCPNETKEERNAHYKLKRTLRKLYRGPFQIARGTYFVIPIPPDQVRKELLPVMPNNSKLHVIPLTDKQVKASTQHFN